MQTKSEKEILRLRQWIADLQSGMYINCVYCGHRYGPDPGTPVAMADILTEHIFHGCPEHPATKLRAALVLAVELIRQWHCMGMAKECSKVAWELYRDNAPEMRPILEALDGN